MASVIGAVESALRESINKHKGAAKKTLSLPSSVEISPPGKASSKEQELQHGDTSTVQSRNDLGEQKADNQQFQPDADVDGKSGTAATDSEFQNDITNIATVFAIISLVAVTSF